MKNKDFLLDRGGRRCYIIQVTKKKYPLLTWRVESPDQVDRDLNTGFWCVCGCFFTSAFILSERHSGGEITISKEALINEEIRDAEVRVIDETGAMLGILPIEDALRLAEERNLDLVNVSPNANPPVCKILDYGKYRYEIQKREKDAKKRQKVTEVKEVRLSTFIEEHDIQVKAKNASKFLQEGNRVKVSLRLRGRERDYANHAIEVMNDFAESLSDICIVDKKPKFEGRGINMFLSPKSDKDK